VIPLGTDPAYLSAVTDPIRVVMEQMNRTKPGQQFQVIVDAARKVVGTVTDGDIRRAILRDVGLGEPVSACMQANFRTGTPGQPAENRRKLETMEANVRFLPVVDAEGHIVDILVPSERGNPNVHALIMAGGFGRRLGERTVNCPKPLLPVGGRPILDHIIERLRNCGIHDISVSVHYLAEQIEAFVDARPDRDGIRLVHEKVPQGTAGAIRMLADRDFEHLLVLNGDILTSLKLETFIDFHREQQNEATIAAATHEVQIPYGVIRYTQAGQFEGTDEKPKIRNLVAAGINLLSHRICKLIPPARKFDMPDLLDVGHKLGMRIGVFPIHEYWTDVGLPEDFERAEAAYRDGPASK
jgi:dTDP-glucose pyrophosphorylase